MRCKIKYHSLAYGYKNKLALRLACPADRTILEMMVHYHIPAAVSRPPPDVSLGNSTAVMGPPIPQS